MQDITDFVRETNDKMAAGGGPAFPLVHADFACAGMTLRDWFAGQAMSAIIGKHPSVRTPSDRADHAIEDGAARGAYAYADAMIAAREPGA